MLTKPLCAGAAAIAVRAEGLVLEAELESLVAERDASVEEAAAAVRVCMM